MKSPYMFIVRPTDGKRYANTQGDLIVSTSEEDHLFSNREAVVVELPINYIGPIRQGDRLLVHHNVFKFYNDMRGRRKSGRSHFKDDLFFVEDIQFFMYNDGTGWKARDKYCFVRPLRTEESIIYKNIEEEPLVGEMAYPNNQLDQLGVKAGDKVSFTPESEYEFMVDGEKLYRMYTDNITLLL